MYPYEIRDFLDIKEKLEEVGFELKVTRKEFIIKRGDEEITKSQNMQFIEGVAKGILIGVTK